MKIHTIESESDYDFALIEVQKLWGAKIGTTEVNN